MDAARLEAFLARIYADPAAMRRFLAAPAETARQAGLSDFQAEALATWDHVGARMAAAGFQVKRARLTAASHDVPLQRRLRRAVWSEGGCDSWYLDAAGVNRTLWPGFTFEYWARTRRARRADYAVTGS